VDVLGVKAVDGLQTKVLEGGWRGLLAREGGVERVPGRLLLQADLSLLEGVVVQGVGPQEALLAQGPAPAPQPVPQQELVFLC
jgi:hypothetical protein